MEPLQLGVAVALSVLVAYALSSPLRAIFKWGQGPIFAVEKVGRASSLWGRVLKAIFRIGAFYCVVAGLITLATAGLVNFLDAPQSITTGALVTALFSVALARILAMTYSASILRSLYAVALGVLAAGMFLVIAWLMTSYDKMHDIVTRSAGGNPNLIPLYGVGVISVLVAGEGCWLFGQRLTNRTRLVPYSLVREHWESQESYEGAAYRGPMEELFARTIARSVAEWNGLQEFCWKTWSGEPHIADALLESVCRTLPCSRPYDQMTQSEKTIQENSARQHIRRLNGQGKARIIMPLHPPFENAPDIVEQILGIRPQQIPDVGIRRYLVINRRHAIISLPIPAQFSGDQFNPQSETGSNFAVAIDDPSRVHEYLTDFDGLWTTFVPRRVP